VKIGLPASLKNMVHPRRKLPAWYYRVLAVKIKEDREIYPEDFDEDLSDLEDDSEEGQEEDDDDDDDDDEMSDRSYNGSDADCYYELKEEREERKRELQEIREDEQEAKEEQQRFERNKENEVQSACEALKSGKESKTAPLESFASKNFRLYSADYVKHCYDPDLYRFKYVEFYRLDKDGQLLSEREAGQINGHIYFNSGNVCSLRPFSPPKHASLDNCRLQDFDGTYDLTIQFLSNDYLKLKVGRELVLKYMPQPPHAPEFFEFVGISSDREKEKEKADRFARPSPGETWFEMNHPMGWWNEY
jgi:hypothetical protein